MTPSLRLFVASALVAIFISEPLKAVEKEVSLVTGEAIGDLAVAGRLSIDLHAVAHVAAFGGELRG
jgi:hypothetical protein